jgi:hypothetical protein
MGTSRPRHLGGKLLGRTGLRNKRMIVYIRIIMVFGRFPQISLVFESNQHCQERFGAWEVDPQEMGGDEEVAA